MDSKRRFLPRALRTTFALLLLWSTATFYAPQIKASTDCDRWLHEYKQGLLQKRATARLQRARHRLHVLAQRKLAGIVFHPHSPAAPHLHRAARPHRVGPLEALKRFRLDCGELPPEGEETALLTPPVLPPDVPQPSLPLQPTLFDAGPPATGILSPVPPSVYTPTSGGITDAPPTGGGVPPGGFGPPIFGGGGGSPSAPTTPTSPIAPVTPVAPGTPTTPVSPTPPVITAPPSQPVVPVSPILPTEPVVPILPTQPGTPVSPVVPGTPDLPGVTPEPESLVLVLTGLGAVGGAIRRRAVRSKA